MVAWRRGSGSFAQMTSRRSTLLLAVLLPWASRPEATQQFQLRGGGGFTLDKEREGSLHYWGPIDNDHCGSSQRCRVCGVLQRYGKRFGSNRVPRLEPLDKMDETCRGTPPLSDSAWFSSVDSSPLPPHPPRTVPKTFSSEEISSSLPPPLPKPAKRIKTSPMGRCTKKPRPPKTVTDAPTESSEEVSSAVPPPRPPPKTVKLESCSEERESSEEVSSTLLPPRPPPKTVKKKSTKESVETESSEAMSSSTPPPAPRKPLKKIKTARGAPESRRRK